MKYFVSVGRSPILCAVALSVCMLAGCGGHSYSASDYSSDYVVNDYVSDGEMKLSTNTAFGTAESTYALGSTSGSYAATTIADSDRTPAEDVRKLIRTVSACIRLENAANLDGTMDEVIQLASACNGHVVNRITGQSRNSTGDLKLKVPKERADEFLEKLKSQGNQKITEFSDNTEDVSMQYADTDSRLASAKAAKERYMTLLETAENVSDVLEIQKRIDEIIADEESYQKQLLSMDSEIEYTAVSIHYFCRVNQPVDSFVTRLAGAFRDTAGEVGDTFLTALTWFFCALTWLVFILPLVYLVIRTFLLAIRKRKISARHKKASAEKGADDGQQMSGNEKETEK